MSQFRTTFRIEPSPVRISYQDPVLFAGSCFSISMGRQFESGRMPVMINPCGTMYNPVSVLRAVDAVAMNRKYTQGDLYYNDGTWISFDHSTEFSSSDSNEIIRMIRNSTEEAHLFISRARFLFVTFGTARVFRLAENGMIVSNCHKLPQSRFIHELLTVDEIVDLWIGLLDKLRLLFPELRVVFTISPVRHWKDGAHGNQVSKSVLFVAIEKLLEHPSEPSYFPSYELVMDDLRDYRFYGEDMIHISQAAVEYIWDAFCHCYFSDTTLECWNAVEGITRSLSHRIKGNDQEGVRKYAAAMLSSIADVEAKHPHVILGDERDYFLSLIEGKR